MHIVSLPLMRRFAPIFCLVMLAAWLVVPASAPAQNDPNGVHVDPNSPSGTEYDIPVERARREAQGTTKKGASRDSGSAPLFGSGIKAKTSSKKSDGSSAAGSGAGGSSGGGSSGGGSGVGGSGAGSGATAATSDPTGGSGATAATGTTPKANGAAGDGKTVDSVASAATVPPADASAAGNAQKVAAEAGNPGGGSGTTLAISGALVVLLLSGLAGWLLRRRST